MFQIIFNSFFFFLFFLSGCKALDKKKVLSPKSYYNKALSYEKKEEYHATLKTLELLDKSNTYNSYTSLSKLIRARVYYKQARYKEALKIYKEIKKIYPSLQTDEVLFKIGLCYLKTLPSRVDTDLSQANEALAAFKDVLHLPFKSSYKRKARKHINSILNLKAKKELIVVRFYQKQDQNQAALLRIRTLLKRYPKNSFIPEILLIAYEVSKKLNKPSQKFKKRLLKEFPKSKEAIKLRSSRN